MEFSIKSGSPEKQRSACVVVGIFEARKLTLPAELLDKAGSGYISDIVRRGDMEGKAGTTLLLHNVPGTLCDRVLLVGLGKEKDFREKEFAQAIRTAVKTLNETGAFDASIFLTELIVKKRNIGWRVRQAAIVALDATYRFDQFKSKKEEVRRPLRKITLGVERRSELTLAEEALKQGIAIAEGMALAKDLGNLPPNVCNPAYLAERAQGMASELALECEVLERADMAKLGMHSLLSVANGAHQPPKLIVLNYRGARAGEKPVVLVGKGVTFDTGGISLKPAAEMDEMKYDMCGAAAVLGLFQVIARLAPGVDVLGVIPAAENLPDGQAYKPGDIIRLLCGKTVEVVNTDAEGRLLLCDALSWAERTFQPDAMVDLATLTGAVLICLGHEMSAVLGNDPAMVEAVVDAGSRSGDVCWPLPLAEDYKAMVKSPVADIRNSTNTREAGTITAACFLNEAVSEETPWAHIDIAGTAWVAKKAGYPAGPTGVGVHLLAELLDTFAG